MYDILYEGLEYLQLLVSVGGGVPWTQSPEDTEGQVW